MITRCRLCSRRPIKARGLCHTCYNRHRRAGQLDRWPITRRTRPAVDVLEDLDHLIETREHPERWPARLEMTPAALEKALYRAGRREQARLVSQVRRRGVTTL